MKQNEFIEKLSKDLGESKARTSQILKTILSNVKQVMVDKDKIALPGFGTFSTREVKARNGYNPQTGESIVVAAHTKVKFVPSRDTKDAINK